MGQGALTCWTVIEGAAAGRERDREEFARRYAPVIRAYLFARWEGSPHLSELDDATQEVFLQCFREGGVLQRADPGRPGGFRAFLFGVVRNVARKFEVGKVNGQNLLGESDLDEIPASGETGSAVFDRAWAFSLVREAAEKYAGRSAEQTGSGRRRAELLRLRYEEGLPIREIARLWGSDPNALHQEAHRARNEFRSVLTEVVAFYHPGSPGEVERECLHLMTILKGT